LRASYAIALAVAFVACARAPAEPKAVAEGSGDAGAKDAAATPPERPFAASVAEASEMISAVVDKKHTEIAKCVRDYRTRKNLQRQQVAVSFGIDQEGKLLGVTAKGKEDSELQSCIQEVLRGAPFPRSHSGVISVTKTYEEFVL
jgi:hypothetical protein